MLRVTAGLAILFSVVFSAAARAETVEICVARAEQFLERNSSADAERSWERKWDSMVEQAVADNPIMDENKFLNQKLMDALAGKNFSNLTRKDRIQACRYYLLYRRRGLEMPSAVKPHLTDANLSKIFG